MQSNELKKRLLDMLEEDKEFRYAVAGAIGYKEILDKFADLEARMDARFAKIDERFAKVEEEIRDLREESNRLRQDMLEGFKRHDKEFARLREDMQEGFKRMDKRLRSIESYIERTSLTLEEEAKDVIQHRLRKRDINEHI